MEKSYTKKDLERGKKLVSEHQSGSLHAVLMGYEVDEDFMVVGICDWKHWGEEYWWAEAIPENGRFHFSIKSPDTENFPLKDREMLGDEEHIYLPFIRTDLSITDNGHVCIMVTLENGVRLEVSLDKFEIMLNLR